MFAWLGLWQLHCAVEKEALLAAFAGAADRPPVSLARARQAPVGEVYPHVRVGGRYDATHTYLLDDQVRSSRQGVVVFTAFAPNDGALPLLVNRGFMPRDENAAIPKIPPLSADVVELSGLYAPPPGSALRIGGNALPAQQQWPKLFIYVDTAEIGEDLGHPIDTRVLMLDADGASGFERGWTPQIIPPEKHRGYAFQWFSFLVATLVIFITLHWRREKPGIP